MVSSGGQYWSALRISRLLVSGGDQYCLSFMVSSGQYKGSVGYWSVVVISTACRSLSVVVSTDCRSWSVVVSIKDQ